ncbi:MAG: hypothetical protein QMD82_03465 [bacterium]|nr:hypothetical protein [bacterium]
MKKMTYPFFTHPNTLGEISHDLDRSKPIKVREKEELEKKLEFPELTHPHPVQILKEPSIRGVILFFGYQEFSYKLINFPI